MNRLKNFWSLVRDAGQNWLHDNATRLAAAVAFYSILSLAPLLVLAVSIAGMVFGKDAARREMIGQMRGLVGDEGAQVVEVTLANANKPEAGIVASIIGIATLLIGASGVFGELHDAMNLIWRIREKSGRGILGLLRDKFLSFGMVLSIGFLLLVSLILSTLLTAFGGYLNDLAPGIPVLMGIAGFVVNIVVISLLFAVLFRFLPDIRIPWHYTWFGAIVTALLFTLGKYLIGLYLAKAAVGTPFGAAGSLVALVVWVYYSALIVFFGVELTKTRLQMSGTVVEPLRNAERIPEAEAKKETG